MTGRLQEAVELTAGFLERTGIDPADPLRSETRYLWTDAFAVCNLLALARKTSQDRYTALAVRLVHRVHETLGRHRKGDTRTGWLGEASESHPTRGGLRIGKKLPERGPAEPPDPRREWDRDGQYLHYLTRWMHALDQLSRFTGDPRFNSWARELGEVAFRQFSYQPYPGSSPRLRWKMSIDLSRPLVPSMGQHDALEGYVTCLQVGAGGEVLAGFQSLLDSSNLVTDDPLGIGGLLVDACRLWHLDPAHPLLGDLLQASLDGLGGDVLDLAEPPSRRLAFRELGLSIGLHGIDLLPGAQRRFAAYLALRDGIEAFWLDGRNRQSESWLAHRDIDEVMLASSLVPEGCLVPFAQTATSPPR
ncbi:MAG: hypothetical protein ACJ79Y_07310 [Myxococcales bacterium]